jgi:hypothetical protein
MESPGEIDLHLPPGSRPVERDRKKSGRSRITNGSALLPGIDGRSPWVRRCKDLINEFLGEQLAGADNCSPAERAIVRRTAVLITELEILEAKFATNNEASSEQLLLYGRTANTLRRLLLSLGLQRRQRDLNPTLDSLLHEHQQRAEIIDEAADEVDDD